MFIPLIIYAFIQILLDDGHGDETYWWKVIRNGVVVWEKYSYMNVKYATHLFMIGILLMIVNNHMKKKIEKN